MNILAISDHIQPQLENADYLRRTYSNIDMVISCGDLPAYYLDYLTSALSAPLFYVRGNHDEHYTESEPGGENLHSRAVRYQGLWLAGLEGSMRYNNGPVQYDDLSVLRFMLSLAPGMWRRRRRLGAGVDILVTHSPPRGIHDLTDQAHRGFKALRWAIWWFQPRYLIHGHVDIWDRRRPVETHVGSTTILNIDPLKLLTIIPSGNHMGNS